MARHKKKRTHLDAGERTWCGIREARTTQIVEDVNCETCKMVLESGGKPRGVATAYDELREGIRTMLGMLAARQPR